MEVREASVKYLDIAKYRDSEIGLIPQDWEVITLASRASIQSGIAKNANATFRDPVAVPYLRVANVQDGYLDLEEVSSINIERTDLSRYAVLPGDVLMNEGGDLDKLGRGALWRGQISPCVHQNHVFVVRCKDGLVPEYLSAWTSSAQARRYFMLAGRQTTNLASMNKTSLGELTVAVPATDDEQYEIANALTDADALIDSLEQLLTKKRQIKQGAMQELLTGKRRLPGHGGVWSERSLVDIATCLDNLRRPLNEAQRSTMRGEFPYCGANGVVDYIDRYCIDDAVILIAEDGGYFDEYLTRPIAYQMSGKFWVNNHAHVLKAKDDFDQEFLFYALVHKNILSFLASGTRAKLNRSELNKIIVRAPEQQDEQSAIAAVLTEMDTEITVLESRLTKARALKQAMAQALLTGRIRLVEPARS